MIVLTSFDSALRLNECCFAMKGHMTSEKRRNADITDILLRN